ncbi:MAG TPA: hypothetical protein VF228_08645 [Iamia sp.]
MTALGDLIDLETYPVDDPDGPGAAGLDRHAAAFAAGGLAILPGFLRPAAVAAMAAEAAALAPGCHHQDARGTPYLRRADAAAPAAHPTRHLGRSALTAVPYDVIPATSLLRVIYEDDRVLAAIRRLLGVPALHRYADPLGALNVAAMDEGDELAWHFDQTDFVVSIALQSSAAGGEFLCAQNLRSAADERFDDVAAVLAGTAPERVAVVPMEPGTLMVFAGRWSLHAVSPVVGAVPRLVALLAFDTEPGTDSSAELKRVRYGRVA